MTKYKVLIFDLDDTLINNLENVRYAFSKMIEARKEKYTDESFLRWYNIDKKFWKDRQDNLIEIPKHLQNEKGQKSKEFLDWLRSQRVLIYYDYTITQEEAIILNNTYMKALTKEVIAINGAYDILNYLSKKYYIVIATNGPSIATKSKLSKINCLDFIDKILSADMFGYMKPKKEFFKAIQNLLDNYNNEDYLMIGDSLKSDVEFAMNCHFDSCWFNQNKEELPPKYKPTMIINNLDELTDLL